MNLFINRNFNYEFNWNKKTKYLKYVKQEIKTNPLTV